MLHICVYCREEVEALVQTLNAQKNVLKKHGITVDGKEYKVKFTGLFETLESNERRSPQECSNHVNKLIRNCTLTTR